MLYVIYIYYYIYYILGMAPYRIAIDSKLLRGLGNSKI